jgi:hypothetical protein
MLNDEKLVIEFLMFSGGNPCSSETRSVPRICTATGVRQPVVYYGGPMKLLDSGPDTAKVPAGG